jgi:hypothetical protein
MAGMLFVFFAALAWIFFGGSATAQTFDKTKLSESTIIDNPWHPLIPGTQMVYEGFAMDGKKNKEWRRRVRTVTDLTKVIDGVRTLIVWDVEFRNKNILVETEIAFFAKDVEGNVWYLGEYPEEYEGGKLVRIPAWIHGRAGASAGIIMPARPRLGMPSYSQASAATAKFSDRAKIDAVGIKHCVKNGCFEDVLVIAEGEENAERLKYYARGVGNVRIGWRGKGKRVRKTLELVEIVELSADARARAMAAALDLDWRSYQYAAKIFDGTPFAEPLGASIIRAHDPN